MKFSVAMINAFLFMSVIDGQRETIFYSSFNTSINGWTNDGGEIKDDNNCPSGDSCLRLTERNEVWREVSTVGYRSIEFSYSVQQNLTEADEFCEVWTRASNVFNGHWAFAEAVQSDGFVSRRLFNFEASEGVENNVVGLNLYSTSICFYNDVLLTGIPMTPSPTANPTRSPSNSPSDSTTNPSAAPSMSPTNDPTHDPIVDSTRDPTSPAEDISHSSKDPDNMSLPTIIAAASSIILCLLCIICGMCVFIKKRKWKNTSEQVEISNVVSIKAVPNNGFEDTNDVNQNDDEKSDSDQMYKTQKVTKQTTRDDKDDDHYAPKGMVNHEVEIGYTNEGRRDKSIIPTPMTPDIGDV